mmetsp:Transcript_13229/g.31855  ORF Transcript_13229/g.31855 Transcript_13229/m.31855 type:complete len:149 (+) Transcript_13229:103-549(+)
MSVPNHIDRDRLRAYERKMQSPAELLVGNMAIGGMIGAFFGYVGGAAVGVMRWNMKTGAKLSFRGCAIGAMTGALVNGALTVGPRGGQAGSHHGIQDASLVARKSLVELKEDLEALRQREREIGENYSVAKTAVKRQIEVEKSRVGNG